MKIIYNLEASDYVNFNQYQIQHFDKAKNKLERQRIAVSVVFVLIGVLLYFISNKYQVAVAMIFVAVSIYWYMNFPSLAKTRVINSTNKAIDKNQLSSLFDEVVLELSEVGIKEDANKKTFESSWEDVNSIVKSLEYIYIFLTSESAIIIPKRVLDENRINELDTLIDKNYSGVIKDLNIKFD